MLARLAPDVDRIGLERRRQPARPAIGRAQATGDGDRARIVGIDAVDHLVPAELGSALLRANVAILNFHKFMRTETVAASKLAKEILEADFSESPMTGRSDRADSQPVRAAV